MLKFSKKIDLVVHRFDIPIDLVNVYFSLYEEDTTNFTLYYFLKDSSITINVEHA